jgi:hypothetical protein
MGIPWRTVPASRRGNEAVEKPERSVGHLPKKGRIVLKATYFLLWRKTVLKAMISVYGIPVVTIGDKLPENNGLILPVSE